MKVLILAGGFATRLWPLTEHRAKPLLVLDGKTILHHILEKIPADFEVILMTNQKFESDFRHEVKKLGRENQVEIFLEDAEAEGEKLGALGAISATIDYFQIREDLIILAGDNLLPELKFSQLVVRHDEAKIAVRSVDSVHEARKFGVVEVEKPNAKSLDPESEIRVLDFAEKPERPKSRLVSTGFMSLGQDLIPILQAYAKKSPDALGGVFTELLAQKKTVWAVEVGGAWFDVGSFETYLAAHKTLDSHLLENWQSAFPTENKFEGAVWIGEGCELENSVVVNTIIYPGTRLKNAYLTHSVVDRDCVLEGVSLSHKLVRAGTRIE
jgi:glucose-1-phosphate thymidylyltransferase